MWMQRKALVAIGASSCPLHRILNHRNIRTIYLFLIILTGNTKGGSITVPLTSCLTGLDKSVLQIKNKNCQLSYSWFQTSQTGGQWYSDTYPFSILWSKYWIFPCNRFSVSQNFCSSVKYLSRMKTLEMPTVDELMFMPRWNERRH